VRVWDIGREQCVRVFDTGLDTCTTAIASRTVAMDFNSSSNGPSYGATPSPLPFQASDPNNSPPLVSWTFTGSADGTVSVFDERVPSSAAHGGRVHCSRDHSAWIVSAHLRADGVPEVITGSVRGVVKFWDLRSMRTFKTYEVHKSPLTALAVHSCAPVIATGSHAQFIKLLTLNGDQLGRIIKYHDGMYIYIHVFLDVN
jgi:WD40 repeat protein